MRHSQSTKNTGRRVASTAISAAAGFLIAVGAGAIAGGDTGLGQSIDSMKSQIVSQDEGRQTSKDAQGTKAQNSTAGTTTLSMTNDKVNSLETKLDRALVDIKALKAKGSGKMSNAQIVRAVCRGTGADMMGTMMGGGYGEKPTKLIGVYRC